MSFHLHQVLPTPPPPHRSIPGLSLTPPTERQKHKKKKEKLLNFFVHKWRFYVREEISHFWLNSPTWSQLQLHHDTGRKTILFQEKQIQNVYLRLLKSKLFRAKKFIKNVWCCRLTVQVWENMSALKMLPDLT